MKWVKIMYTVVGFLLFASVLSAEPFQFDAVLPENMKDLGWEIEDDPFIATNEELLTLVMNGAAPRYVELGTRQALFANYEKGSVFLMVEIFLTDRPANAEKLFAEFQDGSAKALENLGNGSRYRSEMGGTYMIEFFKDRIYVRLSITEKPLNEKSFIFDFAREISARWDKYQPS